MYKRQVPAQSGLGNIAGSLGIPAFNFPFNAITLFFLAALGRGNPHWPTSAAAASASTLAPAFEDVTSLLVSLFADATGTPYEWAKVGLAYMHFFQTYKFENIFEIETNFLILFSDVFGYPNWTCPNIRF